MGGERAIGSTNSARFEEEEKLKRNQESRVSGIKRRGKGNCRGN